MAAPCFSAISAEGADSTWVAVSAGSQRKVGMATLRTKHPMATYVLRVGRPLAHLAHLYEFAVEVDCERRTRRDATIDNRMPTGPSVEVDSWGKEFSEELDFVCHWAREQWRDGGAYAAVPAPSVLPGEPHSSAPLPPASRPQRPPLTAEPAKPPSRASEVLSSGSGFVVAPHSVITNHHVVKGCGSVRVRYGDDLVLAQREAVAAQSDIALLRLPTPFGTPANIRQSALLGEEVLVAGYPLSGLLSNDMIVTSGIVNSLAGLRNDPFELQMSAPVQPGNSGGPMVDRTGSVVGIVVSKLNAERLAKLTGDIAQNVNFAIKTEVLRLFLDANRIKYKSASGGVRLEAAQIAQRARDFTVQVLCME